MEILTAPTGLCIGINRAYRGMNERALRDGPFTATHQNSGMEYDTLRRIERRDPELLNRYPGLEKVSVKYDIEKLGEGERLVLGFHGLSSDSKQRLADQGVNLLDDLICPFIAKLDRVVERHVLAGFDVAIVGTRDNHYCRTASKIAAEHGRRCYVIERVEDVEALKVVEGQQTVLVGQVTGNTETFREVIARIERERLPIKIIKTMCSDSYSRQEIASDLAEKADIVILVDDRGDGAQSVFEVCSRVNDRVHRVTSKEQIRLEWLDGVKKLAIVGGILVPEWTIDEVARHVRMICATTVPAEY
jgi:4-hydroxy-3-methylbut-2-en-1-yl diphosphate reductase